MRKSALVAALVVIAVAAIVLAYYLTAGRTPAQSESPGVVYFSAGASPAPLQAIDYVKRGQLHSNVTIEGQVVAVGQSITPELKETLVQLIANSTMKFGSPNASVVVVEYLDPTCPACIAFFVDYFNYLLQYINNGTVLYVIRYLPTRVFGYLYRDHNPQAFAAGVEVWLSLECIYKRHGPDAVLAAEGVYEVAASYLWAYVWTGNYTYLLAYPVAMRQYLESLHPDCAYNLTLDQAMAAAERAVEQAAAELEALGVPREMRGTPLFVVFPRP